MLEQGQPPLDSQNELDPFIEEQLKFVSSLSRQLCATEPYVISAHSEQNRQQHLMNKYQIEEVKEALISGIGLAFEGIFVRFFASCIPIFLLLIA